MVEFEYKIISGIYPKYIIEYFNDICTESIGNRKFIGDGWEVELIDNEPIIKRTISLPSTNIVFTGNKKICLEEIYKYRMKFLSAGG